MFWFSKVEKENKQKLSEKTNSFTVTFKNGAILNWYLSNWKGTSKVTPWKDFYKWFFCKKTPYYTMKYDNGCTTFCRKDILHFNVDVVTKDFPY